VCLYGGLEVDAVARHPKRHAGHADAGARARNPAGELAREVGAAQVQLRACFVTGSVSVGYGLRKRLFVDAGAVSAQAHESLTVRIQFLQGHFSCRRAQGQRSKGVLLLDELAMYIKPLVDALGKLLLLGVHKGAGIITAEIHRPPLDVALIL